MLKKKIKLLAVIVAIFLLLTSFATVFAEDATNVEDANTQITNDVKTVQGDQYITDNDVTIDYVIDGNLYVIANKVTIKSEIQGDAFIIAKELNVENDGYIFNNLFAVANKMNISGIVYDLYAASQNLTMNGYIYRDMKVLSKNNVSILGTVGRDAFIYGTSNINFQNQNDQSSATGVISRNLTYSASKEMSTNKGNIEGTVNYQPLLTNKENSTFIDIFLTHLYRLACSLVLLAVIWLIGLWLAPKFINNNDTTLTKKPLNVILLGILSIIAIPFIGILLMIPRITISISLIIFALYAILLIISSSISTIVLNNLLCEKTKTKQNVEKIIQLLILGIVLYIVELIPFVGSIVSLALLIIGMGTIFTCMKGDKKKKSTSTKKKKSTATKKS